MLVAQHGSDPSALTNFWVLVEHAGPLRWPTFSVLGVGLALVIAKVYELLRDRSSSLSLFEIDLRRTTLTDITGRVARAISYESPTQEKRFVYLPDR